MDDDNKDSPIFQIIMNMLIKNGNKNYLLNIASNKSRDFAIILIQQSSYVYIKKYILDDFKELNFFKNYNDFGLRHCIEILINLFQEKKNLISIEEEENKQIKLSLDIEISVLGINMSIAKERIQFILINDDVDQIIKNNLIWFSALFLFQEKEDNKKIQTEQEKKIKELKQEVADLKSVIEDLKKTKLLELYSNKIINGNNIIEDEFGFNKSQIVNDLNIGQFEFIKEKIKLIFDVKKLKLKILYSAIINGDTSLKFHELCDYHNNTIVIIQTQTNNIFGGYANKPWNSIELGRKQDYNSFIFSINKQKIYKAKTDNSDSIKYHLYCSDTDGPCFYAFSIENLCIKNGGYCDEICKCNYDSFESEYELNGGIKTFKVKQLEIYEILLNN